MRNAGTHTLAGHTHRIAAFAILVAMLHVAAGTASAATLDRIRDTGKLTLGYEEDARPFSFKDEAGKPAGFSVELCQDVADRLKGDLKLSNLTVDWLPIKRGKQFDAVQQGKVDMLCGAASVTLSRRQYVSFSLPIYPSGIGVVVRSDAPLALREILEYGKPSDRPVWRGYPARALLENKTFSIVAGATSEKWLAERLDALHISANIAPVESYDAGIARVVDGSSTAFFGDLPILLDAVTRNSASGELVVLNRNFTNEPLALAIARGDEDFRLAVDRALSEIYRAEGFRNLYASWFGRVDDNAVTFFRQTALPE